jgi:small-conductance mechanosensitive channel
MARNNYGTLSVSVLILLRLLLISQYIVLALIPPGKFTTRSSASTNSITGIDRRRAQWSPIHLQALLQLPDAPPADSTILADLLLAGILGFATDPFVEMFFNTTHPTQSSSSNETVAFKTTFLYGAADSISVAARVFGCICLTDILIDTLPVQSPFAVNLRDVAPQIGVTLWLAMTLSTVKRSIFKQAVSGNTLGRVTIYDRLIDFVVGIVTVSQVLDELSIDVGMGLQSVFTAGGVGALIFSLASKDLAQQIVGGFAISVWDAFEIGDDVRLGDGTEGTIARIGLVETEIRGFDNVSIRIPNSQLLTQRVSNISRTKQSQVLQLLRFQYSDLKQIPSVLGDIKREIRASCPKLVVDGSKSFNAVVSKYEPDHVQCQVNCHFEIPPGTTEFVLNREEVLLAIARAVEENDIRFAIPSINYLTSGPADGA